MNNPEKSFDLLSLGEVLLRLSPPDNERLVKGDMLRKQVGGAELNVVSGVSLLGLRTGIISKLPANDIGVFAKNRIRFCGVSDDYLVYDESPDARLAFIIMKTEHIRENRASSMTERIPRSITYLWMISMILFSHPPAVSIPAVSRWR